jgi:hypothetical protein
MRGEKERHLVKNKEREKKETDKSFKEIGAKN